MSEEEDWITIESFFKDLSQTGLTRKISYIAIVLSIVIGSYLRVGMGYLDRLVALDPFEMFHLSQHWFTHWEPATVDSLLFPGSGGTLSGVGYPPLTHALPAIVTEFLNLLEVSVSLKQIVIIFPVLVGALLPVVYWFLGKELYNEKVGIIAALLTFVFPQFILIGAAGKYDTNIYIALFYPLILALFVKSFNETNVLRKIKWSCYGGLALGFFGLFWAGYTSMFAMLGFAIAIYTVVATWLDKIKKEDTFSLLGILLSYPILLFDNSLSNLTGVLLVAPMVLLPYVSTKLPEWSSQLSFVEDGVSFRKKLTAAFTLIFFAGVILVYTGNFPLNIRGVGTVKQTAVIHSTISELQSTYVRGLTPLADSFGTIGAFILPVLFLPQVYILYKLRNDFNPARMFELVFVGFTFLMHFLASRFLSLYLFLATPVIAAEILWTLNYVGGLNKITQSFEKSYVKLTSWDKVRAGLVFAFVILILVTSLPVSNALGGDFTPRQVSSVVYQESLGAWTSTFNYLDQNESITSENHVLSWWDYGFAMKVLGNVGVFTDNTQSNAEEAAKFYTMSNISESREYITTNMLEERGEDVDYVVGNKYISYSGKWGAVVTVSSGLIEDHPNMADQKLEEGEEEWIWRSPNQVGNKALNSTYTKLSYYNALSHGAGDSPYEGYEIAYQSPQWYVKTDDVWGITTSRNIQSVFTQNGSATIPMLYGNQVVNVDVSINDLARFGSGPAITLYKVNNTTS
ncbi:hypothetical protein C9439_03590 [archaeon SCG-AAA382B04]|nr:hypothetical protein C9439_03590 [archaeon SCG-AAA382B04]